MTLHADNPKEAFAAYSRERARRGLPAYKGAVEIRAGITGPVTVRWGGEPHTLWIKDEQGAWVPAPA